MRHLHKRSCLQMLDTTHHSQCGIYGQTTIRLQICQLYVQIICTSELVNSEQWNECDKWSKDNEQPFVCIYEVYDEWLLWWLVQSCILPLGGAAEEIFMTTLSLLSFRVYWTINGGVLGTVESACSTQIISICEIFLCRNKLAKLDIFPTLYKHLENEYISYNFVVKNVNVSPKKLH